MLESFNQNRHDRVRKWISDPDLRSHGEIAWRAGRSKDEIRLALQAILGCVKTLSVEEAARL